MDGWLSERMLEARDPVYGHLGRPLLEGLESPVVLVSYGLGMCDNLFGIVKLTSLQQQRDLIAHKGDRLPLLVLAHQSLLRHEGLLLVIVLLLGILRPEVPERME